MPLHGKILKSDVVVAKNYLVEKEIKELERIVSMYLDYAENQAARQIPMKMLDWVIKLDAFLQFNEYEILNDAGKVSHEVAKQLATEQYAKFRVTQDRAFESDFEREAKRITARSGNEGKIIEAAISTPTSSSSSTPSRRSPTSSRASLRARRSTPSSTWAPWGACSPGRSAPSWGSATACSWPKTSSRPTPGPSRHGTTSKWPTRSAALEAWELFDGPANQARRCPHFSVEMETGTGKTYVYLRTIFELSRRYGFQKFIIVVPSVAIREGVLKNIEITAEHFRALYNNLPFEHFVYDAKKVNRLRQFATSNTLQILVINIDAFRKNFTGTEEEQKSNVIYKESDKLSGRQPIEFVQAARPIVIIDEPQSVDSTDKAQEAIKALNPLCTLRYSATHRNPYNLVYRLDPVRAFELKLVKQIVVASAAAEGAANDAFVRVEQIDYKKGIKAKLRIHVQTAEGPKEKSVTVKNGADLFALSNERACYAQGFSVVEINAEPGSEFIRFNNGRTLRLGEEIGGMREDVWRAQIKHTIKRHLEKELQVRERGIKVLSLFFIDRVANYRDYDGGGPAGEG